MLVVLRVAWMVEMMVDATVDSKVVKKEHVMVASLAAQ